MHLTNTERITILMMRGYGDKMKSDQDVTNLFNDTYSNRDLISKVTLLDSFAI